MLTKTTIENFFKYSILIQGNNKLSVANQQGTLIEFGDNTTHQFQIEGETGTFSLLEYIEGGETIAQLNNEDLFLTASLSGCLVIAYKDTQNKIQFVHSNCNLTKALPDQEYVATIRFKIIYDTQGHLRIEKSTSDGKQFNMLPNPGVIAHNKILFCCYPKTQTIFQQERLRDHCIFQDKINAPTSNNFVSYKPEIAPCNIVGARRSSSEWKFYAINII